MRRYIFSVLIALLALPVLAQQQAQAKVVLDKTAAAFRKSGGIKADFDIKSFAKGRPLGGTTGTIRLDGDKFTLKTPDAITWFDGKTQWSYLPGSDEVNVSTPTEAELQSANPYVLLEVYRHGFNYKLGTVKSFRGKPVYEVVLTAASRAQDTQRIVLYVAKTSYMPVYIMMEQRDKSRSEITVTGYQTGMKYADSVFVFDKKQYPHAEIIDLR